MLIVNIVFITKYEENRPKMQLTGLTLNPKDVEIYVSEELLKDWVGAESIIDFIDTYIPDVGKKYIDIVNDPKRLFMTSSLYPNDHLLKDNNKMYMFINLCSKSDFPDSKSDKILVLGALNIILDVDVNKIKEFKIDKVYSINEKGESFGAGVKLDVNFDRFLDVKSLSDSNKSDNAEDSKDSKDSRIKFEMPVAYACKNGEDTSLHLKKIHDYKYECDKTNEPEESSEINFLKPQIEASEYIGFFETAYLVKCKTSNMRKPYYYSVVLNKTTLNKDKDKAILNLPRERNGKKLFYAMAKKAKQRGKENQIKKHNIIQKSVRKTREI